MQYGVFLPNFGPFADPVLFRDLAGRAEAAGWEGFFIWDHVLFSPEQKFATADPWVALAAAATATNSIRLGAVLTPLARRRPWKVARETVTLDHLSGGRLVFAAGLGWNPNVEFGTFGEEVGDRTRARKFDDALTLLVGLWSGERVDFHSEEYDVGPVTFLPTPLQQPRIPIWIGGCWPNRPPFRRAARFDGVVPELAEGGVPSVEQVSDLVAYISRHRSPDKVDSTRFDVVINGPDCWSRLQAMDDYERAGATWWLERLDPDHAFSPDEARRVIDRGPPPR